MSRAPSLRVCIALATAVLSANSARADPGLIHHLNNHLEGSLGAEHLSYSEFNNSVANTLLAGSDLDTESGTLVAAGFSAGWQGKLGRIDKLRAGVEVRVSTGSAVYNGYLQDLQTGALTPLQSSTNETFVDLQNRIGKGFSLMPGNRDLLTPYAGFGLTAWNRELTGTGGYTERYEHYNWQIGGQYQIVLHKALVLSLDAGFGKTFDASMTSSILPNTFDLGSTWMQSYDLGLRYLAFRRVYLGVDAYWKHYGYGQSPAYNEDFGGQAASVLEPNSKTVRDGAVLTVGFTYR